MLTILSGLLFYVSNSFEFRGLIPAREKFPVCPATEREQVEPHHSARQAAPWYKLEAQHRVCSQKNNSLYRSGAVNVQHEYCISSGLFLKVPYNVTFGGSANLILLLLKSLP